MKRHLWIMNRWLVLTSTYFLLILLSCSRSKKILLSLDISQKQSYILTYNTGSRFIWNDSVADFTTTLTGRLSASGSTKDSASVIISTDSIFIVSTIMDSSEVTHLKKCYEKKEFSIPTVSNAPFNSLTLLDTILGSDKTELYKKLIKLIPALPRDSVSEGFAWERTFTLPLTTNMGNGKGTVYQSYSFDSLTSSDSVANISWKFRYSVENKSSEDTLKLLNSMPNYGNGQGWSLIDIKNRRILKSKIEFETPVCRMKNFSVEWHENAILTVAD